MTLKGRENKLMKKKFTKRLLSWVMVAAMVISMLPISAMATGTDGNVAQIVGGGTYGTLDEAIKAAKELDDETVTIKLLADATTEGFNLATFGDNIPFRNIIIEGQTGNETITFNENGIALAHYSLELKNCNVVMNSVGATPYGEWNWQSICASEGVSLTLDNVDMTMDGENAIGGFDEKTQQYKTVHAIYFCNNNEFNVINNSNITIKNYSEDALEWDGGGGTYRLNITDSSLVADKNRSGLTGTFDAYITNSNVNVTNSRGNGSNGSNYYIKNSSVVNFSNNGNHGISATDLVVENNSVVTADSNGYYGVYVNGDFLVDGTSKMVVTKNSSAGDKAGLKLYTGVTDGKVEKGAVVTITDNYCSGLSNNGKCVFEEGAKLTITGNDNEWGAPDASHGGGIYNSGTNANLTLPSDAVIYNNHAATDGDDIFNNTTATITFGKVDPTWVLDDCDHLIDGWYDDSEGTRWEAHADTEAGEENHIEAFTDFAEDTGLAAVTGLKALKAAHGAKFEDKTSYPGLTKDVSDLNDEKNWQEEDKAVDVAAGNTVNFKLTSNVPDDLRNYLNPAPVYPPVIEGDEPGTPEEGTLPEDEQQRGSYTLTFHDVMNEMLTNPGSFIVTIGEQDSETIPLLTLTENTHYTINTTPDPHQNEDGTTTTCTFEITLDLAELYERGKEKGINVDAYIDNAAPITVTYQATLNGDAVSGQFENKAWVTAPNWKTSEDVVYVNTYAINIFKYDQATNEALPGATFTLYSDEDCADEHIVAADLSDDDGLVSFDGLDAGTYYLKETKAPDGYVCSDTVVTIIIGEGGQQNAKNIVSVKFANSLIPHTGGMGTTMFSIVGGALIATAGVIFVISRKKRARNAA